MKTIKQTLRRKMREQRSQLTSDLQASYAKRIEQQLCHTHYFLQAQHIALYLAFNGEVPTTGILHRALTLHKSCYVPVLIEQRLQFVKITKNSHLTKNHFGILEPHLDTQQIIAPWALDLVLMPLVAFDNYGHRLGMGGGFYDRTFYTRIRAKQGTSSPHLVGLAYDFQRISYVPHSDLDILLDAVFTEKTHYIF